ncbi:uncharacterized protein RHIMIDRAFT_232451 [Rhizopus microsporus ATCC 52813]|uniref:Uncharacterized protein n=1 Tax=Rhizopus microsporus ATCC 52813 TaxID=1340429 RepID=A0A2G4T7K7_RHIZD|nr:uncharacterized protein RHIMIDRAFT_232451 [Rhizopus microsporus ATCC 52813]PHZ17010.1 hypothetical protein RHIMIDRAFT_232451 [Rhizopus microsporus ATCC 52813]
MFSVTPHIEAFVDAIPGSRYNEDGKNSVNNTGCFPSTYLLCRSSSIFTNDIRCRPAALCALSDFDTSNGTTSVASLVPASVLEHGKDATLKLETVITIFSKLKNGPDKKIFQSLIDQFNDMQEILILEN